MGYGSVYQSGYVFAIDDTTATTGSVGGTVLQESDTPSSTEWSNTATELDVLSLTDGAGNTSTIVNALGTLSGYAAPVCSQVGDGGYSDWYLPAIDELDGGTQSAFTILGPLGIPAATDGAYYWSSTEYSADPTIMADAVLVTDISTANVLSGALSKSDSLTVRCARAITTP
ncbi:hypothetical protein D7S86_08055 [Pararobbsia silviterrae]|uniref:DUF1566 domain-containing protein n=1 Tax=Pararobbsia silviterrae TaxID=1792498 RepID=A0A494Y4D7_9BURK|nr:hypothetical protein D7S86_08055 [Pararobbsia silviterrae]